MNTWDWMILLIFGGFGGLAFLHIISNARKSVLLANTIQQEEAATAAASAAKAAAKERPAH